LSKLSFVGAYGKSGKQELRALTVKHLKLPMT
jgi:hypothetical protein